MEGYYEKNFKCITCFKFYGQCIDNCPSYTKVNLTTLECEQNDIHSNSRKV